MFNNSSIVALTGNGLQISEGTNSSGIVRGIWAFAYVLLSAALLWELILTI